MGTKADCGDSGELGRPCVLLLHDDPCAAIEIAQDFDVLCAASLDEALGHIGAGQPEICAIVSDLRIPGTPGIFHRPRALWQRAPAAARIILTDEDIARQTLTGASTLASANQVVKRPWRAGKLLAAIRRAIQLAPGAG